SGCGAHRYLHSFPTRRSSDLIHAAKDRPVKWPSVDNFKADDTSLPIEVIVENTEACPRYSGLTISGVTVSDSPAWLQNRLRAIGDRKSTRLNSSHVKISYAVF